VERELWNPEAILINVSKNSLKRNVNLGYDMGEDYDVMNTVKTKIAKSKLILSDLFFMASYGHTKRQIWFGSEETSSYGLYL
jgi:hypothetical protein